MKKLVKVAINDFKLIFRDNSLKVFILLPLLILVVIRYAVPYVAGVYEVLNKYFNVILMFATMQGSIAFGFIYSMVLVDEKDTNVAKVYGILPVSKFWFVVFRLVPPYFLATLATFLLLLYEPFYGLPPALSFVYSALAGLVAPLMTLFIAIVAKNKIEAMTWQKLFNIPLFLPVLAIFLPFPLSLVFAISPTYWAYQGFNFLIAAEDSRIFLLIGFVHTILVLVLMIKRLNKIHFQ
jgi:fluoroquinolone transport system permease protein